MSLAEKIKTITENVTKVYEAGYEAGKNLPVEYIIKAGTYTVDPYKLFSYYYSHSINLNFVSNGQSFTSIKVPTESEYMSGDYRVYYDDVYVYDDFDTWAGTSYEYQYITIESDQKVTRDVYEIFFNGTDYSDQLWQLDNTFEIEIINNYDQYDGIVVKYTNTATDVLNKIDISRNTSQTIKVNKHSLIFIASEGYVYNGDRNADVHVESSTCGWRNNNRNVELIRASQNGTIVVIN